jgi:hypothetical protein
MCHACASQARVYAGRVAGGDRHHRDPDRAVAAGGPGCPGRGTLCCINWAVAILPCVELRNLYDRYNVNLFNEDQPIDPTGWCILQQLVSLYTCPDDTTTNRGTFWAYSYTCHAVGSVSFEPRYIPDFNRCSAIPGENGSNACKRSFGSFHAGRINFAFADVSVRLINTGSIDLLNTMVPMGTMAGNEASLWTGLRTGAPQAGHPCDITADHGPTATSMAPMPPRERDLSWSPHGVDLS